MNRLKSRVMKSGASVSPLETVASFLRSDPTWSKEAGALTLKSDDARSVHLAIFVEPFLEYVLNGKKTVESRFSTVRFPPYGRVARGDLILLKESGGPVVGICEVGAAWFYRLTPDSWKTIRRDFAAAICAESPDFWHRREQAEFATLMYVSRIKRFPPVPWPKRDRRGWVVLRSGGAKPLFGGLMKSTVLGFSGGIASGKSTLSEAVALSIGCPRVSFGSYVRLVAKRRGLPTDRDTLQSLGEKLVTSDPDGICKAVLALAQWVPGTPLIIDGIRHGDIVNRLRRLVAPGQFRLIHLSTDLTTREARFSARGEIGSGLAHFESHSTERDVVARLPDMADFVLDGTSPIEQLIEKASQIATHLP